MWWMIPYAAAKTLLGTRSETKVAKSQNKAIMSQLGKQINQINLQRAQSLEQTGAALFNIDVARDSANSQIQLQSAASGTVGASVKDAVSTVNTAADRQESNAYSQAHSQMTAYQLAANTAVDNAHNRMDWESGTNKLWNNTISNFGSMLGSATVSALVNWDSTQDSSATQTTTHDYNYDLWGRDNSVDKSVQTWKSYLNK